VWTTKQATLLRGFLGERGHHVTVRHAMRYGNPSIPQVLDELKAAGHGRILVLPLYPQYSGTTTASVFDAVYAWGQQVRSIPEFRFVNRYPDHPGYIDALARSISTHWQHHGRPDKLVMSFHGVPARTRTLGDPYHDECQQTARLLAHQLGLRSDQYQLTFQSRFGKAEWLQPYTQPTVEALAHSGTKRIDVVCPGFTSDCLETLEEINMEVREAFLHQGGKEFHYIPCLNDNLDWIRALTDIAEQQLEGWPTKVGPRSAPDL
jgi:ferrochelatase